MLHPQCTARLTAAADGRHTDRVSRPFRPEAAVALAVIAGAGLRTAGAALRPPWHDEYFTVWLSSQPWGELLPALAQDSGPPLPYVLAKLLTLVGLPPLAAARTTAGLTGTLAIAAVAAAGRLTGGRQAALWAAVIVALHPLAMAWSCEGRAYAFLLLAAALVWLGLAKLAHGGRGGLALAGGVALAAWSHGLGLALATVVLAGLFLLPAPARRSALLALAAGVGSFVPWLPVMAAQPPQAVAWMVRAWQALPLTQRAAAPVELLPLAARFGNALDLPSAPGLVAIVVAGAALGLAVLALRQPTPTLLLTLVAFAVPAGLLAALAQIGLPAFYPGRGEALYFGPAMGVLAAGASRGRAAAILAAGLAGAGLATQAAAFAAWHRTPPRPEQVLAQQLLTHLPAGGTVLIEGYWRLGLWYHLQERRQAFDLRTFPPAAQAHPGWYEGGATAADAEAGYRNLVHAAARGEGAACVLPPTPAPSALRPAAIAAGLTLAVRLPGAELWVRPPGPP